MNELCNFIIDNLKHFKDIVERSEKEGIELGCDIIKENGQFKVVNPCRGDDCSLMSVVQYRPNVSYIADFHTHPAGTSNPSFNDLKSAYNIREVTCIGSWLEKKIKCYEPDYENIRENKVLFNAGVDSEVMMRLGDTPENIRHMNMLNTFFIENVGRPAFITEFKSINVPKTHPYREQILEVASKFKETGDLKYVIKIKELDSLARFEPGDNKTDLDFTIKSNVGDVPRLYYKVTCDIRL